MINWTYTTLRFTSGIGALCMCALMAEVMPRAFVWAAITMAVLPFVAFVFLRRGDISLDMVRKGQLAASIWYFALAVIVTTLYFKAGTYTNGWPRYFLGLSLGAIPCGVVIWEETKIQWAGIGGLGFGFFKSTPTADEALSRIPPLRRQQFSYIESAKKEILAWARVRRIPLHRVEFVVPFVKTDFSLSVWIFYTTDSQLFHEEAKNYHGLSAVFLEILEELHYPSEWMQKIAFTYDSHEHVERDFEGSYFFRLR